MNRLIFVWFLLVGWSVSFGQSQETLDKIEAAKIALITERLNLTPDQAERFWPIYKEFTNKQLDLRNEFQELKRGHNPQTATEEQNQVILEKGLQIKERQLGLEKTYAERFQQVITTRQLMSLRKAEDDFREMLMQRIRQRQTQRDQMQRDRMRNESDRTRKQN